MSPSLDCDRVVVGSFEGEVSGSEFVVGVRLLGVARTAAKVRLLIDAQQCRKERTFLDAVMPASQYRSCRQHRLPRRTNTLDVVPAHHK
jgi:hypothetical protein